MPIAADSSLRLPARRPAIAGERERAEDAEAEVAERDRQADQAARRPRRGSATTDRVWPANVWRRSTMNQPMTPASTATIVPGRERVDHELEARRAADVADRVPGQAADERRVSQCACRPWCTDGRLGLADDDEPAVGGLAAPRSACRTGALSVSLGDHLARRPSTRAAAGEVDDPVEVAEDRVDVVGDEQHGHALARGRSAATSAATAAWLGRSRLSSGSSSSSSSRPADQRLRDQQALLLAAGELADRPVARSAVAPTSSITSSTRCRAPRGRRLGSRGGSGMPQRSPSSPSRTMSTPRMRVPASKLRRCGR